MKIFQIGFNRCGTTSIHQYLLANGVKSVHWDNGRLARIMFRNLANGNMLLDGYENFDAFLDMESLDDENGLFYLEGYKLFPFLAAQYPDGVFLLNTRDREAWIQSRFRLWRGAYAAQHKVFYGVKSDYEIANVWRAEWERHHNRVIEFFSTNRHRFFVCRIETDLPSLLNEKLPECKLDTYRYEDYKDPQNNKFISRHRKFFQLQIRRLARKSRSICESMLSGLER